MKYCEIEIGCPKCGEVNKKEIDDTKQYKAHCFKCSTELFIATPARGLIYLLTNKYIPNLIKIGFTTRSIEERLKELSSGTGVPIDFECSAAFVSSSPYDDEKKIHSELKSFRVSNKEFFEIDLIQATKLIFEILNIEPAVVNKEVSQFFKNLKISKNQNLKEVNSVDGEALSRLQETINMQEEARVKYQEYEDFYDPDF